MKKIIVSLLVLFTVGSGFAQDAATGKKHRFGLKMAPGVSWLNVKKIGQENDGASYSFGYGLQYEYAFSDFFSLSTGVLMNSFRGNVIYTDSVKFAYEITNSGVVTPDTADLLKSRRYTFKSVDVPLTLKLKTPEIGYLTYYGEFGTTINVVYDAYSSKNNVILRDGLSESELTEGGEAGKFDEREGTNWLNASLNIGIGAEYNLVGNTSLLVGINYNSSFTNILKKEPSNILYKATNSGISQTVRAESIALTVGVQF